MVTSKVKRMFAEETFVWLNNLVNGGKTQNKQIMNIERMPKYQQNYNYLKKV